MRRLALLTALAVAAALLGGPLFATEMQAKQKREDEKKEASAPAKPGEPAKPADPSAPPPACAPTTEAAPAAGTAGFFKTVEDIYGFEGSLAALAGPTPAKPSPEAKPAPAAADAQQKKKMKDDKAAPKKAD